MKFLGELILFPFQVAIFLIALAFFTFWWIIGKPIKMKRDGKVVGSLRWFTITKE